MLVGCQPPHYTVEHAREIKNEHFSEVEDWFGFHKRDAKLARKSYAYSNGIDLMKTIKGTYKCNGKEWDYVNDYVDDIMYTSEDYAKVCDIIEKTMALKLELIQGSYWLGFNGVSIEGECANDEEDADIKDGERVSFSSRELLPVGTNYDNYAAEVIAGEKELEYGIFIYADEIPLYNQNIFEKYPNLNYLSYRKKIENEYEGMYDVTYYKDGINFVNYCHFEKLDKNLYGGYIYDDKVEVDHKLIFTRKNNKEFVIEIPENTKLILFSKKKLKSIHYRNSSNSTIDKNQLTETEKDKCKYAPGYIEYYTDNGVADYVIKDNSYKCYEFRKSFDGIYSIELK